MNVKLNLGILLYPLSIRESIRRVPSVIEDVMNDQNSFGAMLASMSAARDARIGPAPDGDSGDHPQRSPSKCGIGSY